MTFNSNVIAENFTSAVSDHLSHFTIIEDLFANSAKSKSNIVEKIGNILTQIDLENGNWEEIIDVNKQNLDLSLNNFDVQH